MSPLYYSGDFLFISITMAIKVLINALGQHQIADVKQVENTETGEVLAYWLREPRLISYVANADGNGVSINFVTTCAVGVTGEYSVRADHIVSILDAREDVLEAYRAAAFPTVEDAVGATLEAEEEAAE